MSHAQDNAITAARTAIAESATKLRENDRGRRSAYDAEGRAFGGFWYEDSCTSPKLGHADLREMFEMVVDWAIENLIPEGLQGRAQRNRPKLEENNRRYDFCRGSFKSPGGIISMNVRERNAGRLSCLLHEVAHWCIFGGKPHGRGWQRCFVELVREFMGKDDGYRLAREFGHLPMDPPVGRPMRAPRRSFLWSYSDNDGLTWHACKRKDLKFHDGFDEEWAKSGNVCQGWLVGPFWKEIQIRADRR